MIVFLLLVLYFFSRSDVLWYLDWYGIIRFLCTRCYMWVVYVSLCCIIDVVIPDLMHTGNPICICFFLRKKKKERKNSIYIHRLYM